MNLLALACGHCGVPESAAAVDAGPDVTIRWHRALCEHVREALQSDAAPEDLLVIGPDPDRQVSFLEETVRHGIHPLRVRFLDAWRLMGHPDTLPIHVLAAVARTRASLEVGSAPMRESRTFRGRISRRAFLVPTIRYRAPLVRIDASRCRASSGCDLCIRACPVDAIGRGVPPTVDPDACTSCALCLPACPESAIGHPSLDVAPIIREAEVLADRPGRSLAVVCESTAARAPELGLDPASWRVLVVPSLASLRPSDVLRIRALGFRRILGLGDGACCPGTPGPFGILAEALAQLERPGWVVHWNLADGPIPDAWTVLEEGPAEPVPDARSLHALVAALGGSASGVVELSNSGAGLVSVDPDRCTLCGVCAERCFAGALVLEAPVSGVARLAFDHEACSGCGVCREVCPEKAIDLRFAIDPGLLGRRTTLKEDAWVLCASCGERVAPRRMIVRVQARLKTPCILDLCPACKPRQAMRVLAKP